MAATLAGPAAAAPPARRPRARRRAAPCARSPRAARRSPPHNPRQIAVPLLTPILFALVIAPALRRRSAACTRTSTTPRSWPSAPSGCSSRWPTTFAGLSVLVDRDSGAQRELLAAPVPRPLLVLGNLVVVLGLCALQVFVVIAAAALRGADFHVRAAGVAWFVAAAVLFIVLMYGIAETLAAPDPPAGGVHRGHPGHRDPAVVLRGRAVPDRRAARCADRVRQGPAAHPRDGAHALRVRRPRAAPACTTSGA